MAVSAPSIVEHLYVIEDIGTCLFPRFVDLLLDSLLLQAAEDRLGRCIVPTVSWSAHAWFEVMRNTEAIPGIATILGALVGVNDDWLIGAPSPHCHQQCVENERFGQRRFHRPTNHLACDEVDDDGQV